MREIHHGHNEVPSNCNMSENEKFLFDLFREQKINSNPISEETFLPVLKYLRQKYEKIDVNKISEISDKIGKEKFWLIIKSQVLNHYIRESGSDYEIIPRDWLGELSLLEPSLINLFFQNKYRIGKDEYQKFPDIMEEIYTKLLNMGDISTISQNLEAFGKDQRQLARDCLKQGFLVDMRNCLRKTDKDGEKFAFFLKIIVAELKLGKYENFNYVTRRFYDFHNKKIKDLLNLWDITKKITDSNLKYNVEICQENIKNDLSNFYEINEVVSNEDMRRYCEITGKEKMYLNYGFREYDNKSSCFIIYNNSYQELPDDVVKKLQETESQRKSTKSSQVSSDEIYNILKDHNYVYGISKEYNEVVDKINELLGNSEKYNKFDVKHFREILQYSNYPYITIDDDDEVDRDNFHVAYPKFLQKIFKFFYETKYEDLEKLGITREDYDRFFRILANKGITIDLGIGEIRKSDSLPF